MVKIKDKIKNIKFENKLLIIIFIFLFIINILAPITGDDWGNASSKFSFIGAIESAIDYYKTWEVRIIFRL